MFSGRNKKLINKNKSNLILLFQRIVPHYRISIFRELYKRFNILVCHSREKKGSTLSDEWEKIDYPHMLVKRWYPSRKDSIIFQNVLSPLFKCRPKIVITEFSFGILSNWLLLSLKYLMGYKLIFWSHGWNRKQGFNPARLKDKMRIWLYNRVDSIILYSYDSYKVLIKHVSYPKKIFVAPNTLDTNMFISLKHQLQKVGKQNLKEKWNLKHQYLIIFIGRIIKDKMIDVSLEVFNNVQRVIKDVGFIIIGDGPEREHIERLIFAKQLSNCYLLGQIIDKRKTAELLFISDVLLNPGDLGLSVVHAFCFDIPVISQKKGLEGPFHGPEVEYVLNGKTGFLTENKDFNGMKDRIIELFSNQKLALTIKQNIQETINNECCIDRMINGFMQALNYVGCYAINQLENN